ncbi:MAG: VWA domain-containing protein [Gaiellales bacterium]
MRRRRAALCAALIGLVVAAPAAAAGSSNLIIRSIDTSRFPTVRVTVQASQAGKAPVLTVTENGQPASNLAMVDPGAGAAIALVIDTSNSMKGKKMSDAIAAASGFVASQKSDNLLAVYGFNSKPYSAASLTTDRTQLVTAVGQLGVGGPPGTALYGAVSQAAGDLKSAPAAKRVMILLTDGASSRDSATLSQAIGAAKQAAVTIYPVGIATSAADSGPLQQLASATGGTFTNTSSSSALRSVYAAISSTLGSTYTFTYQSLVPAGRPIDLKVQAQGQAAVSQSVMAPGKYVAPSGGGGMHMPTSTAARVVVAGLAALFVLLSSLVLLAAKPSVVLHKRIAHYTEGGTKRAAIEATHEDGTKLTVFHQLFIATEKIVGSMKFWHRMADRLEQADLPLRTAELFYIQMATSILFGLISVVALGRRGVFALIALAVGGFLPALFVKYKARKRLSEFESQLPETLITMAASLKAGHAFNQAVQSVVREGADPTAKEFARVIAETQLGMPAEQALDAMAQRMHSYNFGFVVIAVNIQRTVGGSLADILDMVSDTVRQRQQFERKVKALTAQGRMSAYVLLAMPFLMGLAIFALNPQYMSILFTSGAGKAMIAAALVMMGIGSLIIRKIVSFKG